MAEAIKVAVRVRPFNQREMERKATLIVDMQGNTTTIKNPQAPDDEPKKFTFDFSYWSHDGYKEDEEGYMHIDDPKYCDQKRVFQDLGEGVLKNAWLGYNCSLFAYGQTGSGKSYSIVGYGANKGVIPVVCQRLFGAIEAEVAKKSETQYEVTLSMIEIYNEQVRDLLNAATMKIKGGLKIREHPKKGFYIEKLSNVTVTSYANIESKMDDGTKNRTIAATSMNATSSRAHTIVALTFTQKGKNDLGQGMTKSSVINLVDLAGSERAASTQASGDRLKEGAAINQSLSSLGNVIAALADIASDPGKGKKIIVPFRDSSLTKLLKNALTGNSKSVMMAAVSPADINYDESLSTLKFADRVKRIKTSAVVNESPTDKLIRELREENAKLMKMLGGGGIPEPVESSGGPVAMTGEEKERIRKELEEEVRAQMKQNEGELENAKKSWEDKLLESQKELEREKAERKQRDKQEAKRKNKPYFWNINEDPALSGIICHYIEKPVMTVGKAPDCDVVISGLSILDHHATVNVVKKSIFLEVCPNAKVIVNGETLTTKKELNHNDRIVYSSGHVYVVHHPRQYKEALEKGDTFEKVTWENLHQEIAKNSGYDVDKKGKTEEELILQEDLISIMPMVNEANAISEELDKKKVFEIALVSPQARGLAGGRTYVMVKMKDLTNSNFWMWDRNKFINRKYKMQEMYQNFIDGDTDWDLPQEVDPFYENTDDEVLIGQCQVYLKCLTYRIGFEESIIITDYQAKEKGFLQVEMHPLTNTGEMIGDDDDDYFVDEPSELIGQELNYEIKIVGAKGLPTKLSKSVYCKFQLYLNTETHSTDPISDTCNPDWHWKRKFKHAPVTEQLLSYLTDDVLVIEVWGKQCDVVEKNAGDLSTKQLRLKEEKTKRQGMMKQVAVNPAVNLDIVAAMRKVEKMHTLVNQLKGIVANAKQASQATVEVKELEKLLEQDKFEEVKQLIEFEKENPASQVCSMQ